MAPTMNAAQAFPVALDNKPSLSLAPAAIPAELQVLLDESPKMNASFARLSERDRVGFLRYIEEPLSVLTRERRAAIVAMSLIGLARDLREDGTRTF